MLTVLVDLWISFKPITLYTTQMILKRLICENYYRKLAYIKQSNVVF